MFITTLQRLGRLTCNICETSFMGSAVYVMMIGFLGTAISVLDVLRIMNCKKPEDSRCKANGIVPAEIERDLKLMTSILGIEHSTFIMLGAMTAYPMLHAPWLLMQLCIIAIEFLVFLVRLFLEGLHVSRDEIVLALLALHNWFQVYCLFQRQFYRQTA